MTPYLLECCDVCWSCLSVAKLSLAFLLPIVIGAGYFERNIIISADTVFYQYFEKHSLLSFNKKKQTSSIITLKSLEVRIEQD